MVSDIVFEYNGTPITFSKGDRATMINATEMAKPFGKLVSDWTRLQASQAFLEALKSDMGNPISELIQIVRGGDPSRQGTWMHEDVALEFARWLSPKFAIWCNARIKELLTTGQTQLSMPSYPEALRQWAKAIEDNERLQAEMATKQALIEEQQPKAVFADAICGSRSCILVGQLAKILTQNGHPIGQNRLFEWMRKNGYLGTVGERYNIPNQRYVEQGLFEIKTSTYSNGTELVTRSTVKVTGKGQQFFINKFMGDAA